MGAAVGATIPFHRNMPAGLIPVAPGPKVPEKDWRIIESMPVKSLITRPKTGVSVKGRKLDVRGHAWAGDRGVRQVHVSTDFGAGHRRQGAHAALRHRLE